MTNKIQEILDRAKDVAQGASNAVAGNVSAPVDGIAWLMRKAGIPVGATPFGGSDWMAQQGLTAKPQNRVAELTGEFLGMAGPMAIGAKAPQIANKLLQASDNLNAPNRLAGPMAKQQGIFAGHLAKDAPIGKLEQAKKMQAQGMPDEQIYAKTGWFGGMPDKQWRYEIPDDTAKFNTSGIGAAMRENDLPAMSGVQVPVNGLLSHPSLMDAYPNIGRLQADLRIKTGGMIGAMDSDGGKMHLFTPARAEDARSTMLHEIQHDIQKTEGFALGGSPDSMPLVFEDMAAKAAADAKLYRGQAYSGDPLNTFDVRKPGALKKSLAADRQTTEYRAQLARMQQFPELQLDAYRRLAGEAEARLVQSRMNMTQQQRAASYPPSMFDVPAAEQIVRFK